MDKLIIRYNTGIVVKELKTSYSELTFGDYLKILENRNIKDVYERIKANIAIIAGLTVEEVNMFPGSHIEALTHHLKFIDNVKVLQFETIEEKYKINVGAEAWGKLEQVKILIQNKSDLNLLSEVPTILRIYLGDLEEIKNFEQMNFMKAFNIAKHCVESLENFFKKYTRLKDFKPEIEQIQAGVNQLDQYGFFTTLHALAKGNPLNYDELLKLPADNIYQTLVLDFELSEYNKRYNKIKNKKSK